MLARPGQVHWSKALASWTCPTPADNSDAACDPCGRKVWGNWDHLACRGAPMSYTKDAVPGTGVLTNVHITDYSIEGEVPLEELCVFKSLREFDLGEQALKKSPKKRCIYNTVEGLIFCAMVVPFLHKYS